MTKSLSLDNATIADALDKCDGCGERPDLHVHNVSLLLHGRGL
jgi:hypothetical protein